MNNLSLEQLYTRQQENKRQIRLAQHQLTRFAAAEVSKETLIMTQHKLERLEKHDRTLQFQIDKRLKGRSGNVGKSLL